MSDFSDPVEGRRKFLKLVGGSVALIPLAGLSGCSGDKEPAAPAPKPETAKQPTEAMKESAGSAAAEAEQAKASMEEAAGAAEEGGGLPKLSEDDPQAKALNYKHAATDVDAGKNPRYKPGQVCSNCALFQAGGDETWARCSIFPGKLVNAEGWCSAYAPKG